MVDLEPIFAFCEGQPSAGDTIVLPGDSFTPPRENKQTVVITTLHPKWEPDDDCALVATYEATLQK